MNPFNLLVIHEGDEDIKCMLCEQSCNIVQKPEPPNDVAMRFIKSNDYKWLVIRFFCPGDEGYLAYGLPLTLAKEEMELVWTFILESFAEDAIANGIDPVEHLQIIREPEPQLN